MRFARRAWVRLARGFARRTWVRTAHAGSAPRAGSPGTRGVALRAGLAHHGSTAFRPGRVALRAGFARHTCEVRPTRGVVRRAWVRTAHVGAHSARGVRTARVRPARVRFTLRARGHPARARFRTTAARLQAGTGSPGTRGSPSTRAVRPARMRFTRRAQGSPGTRVRFARHAGFAQHAWVRTAHVESAPRGFARPACGSPGTRGVALRAGFAHHGSTAFRPGRVRPARGIRPARV